ncbi:DUF4326 domain-containing protein [Micromonospora chersina]|uniref:DUF4326 domain-containing protein n=1 Tax=Micromonospora chersina TaxID=47854 RepID=UPI0037239CA2
MPTRIQRKRVKGWRWPEGAVYVGRPTKWGNPYRVTDRNSAEAREAAVNRYREIFDNGPADLRATVREQLAGRDLLCWCRLDQPCHADVLLEIANGGDR